MKKKWINLVISNISSNIDEFCDFLLESGALSATVQGKSDRGDRENAWFNEPGEPLFGNWKGITVTSLYPDSTNIDNIQKMVMEAFPDDDLIFSVKFVIDRDWVRHTQHLHKPLEIVPGTWIVAPWHKIGSLPERSIIIDPGIGFGTGTHPTTFLCLEWICRNIRPGLSFLDYGCGSGILALTASAYGAEQVHAVDIDDQAIEATINNSRLNKMNITVGAPVILMGKKFDIIVANILSGILIDLLDDLINYLNPAGILVMSGILDTQVDRIITAADNHLKIKKVDSRENWVLIESTRLEI